MAVDEALLNRAADEPGWTLRFYGWCAPTLSLGYFQSYRSRASHPASLGCAVTRRPSGGGAILHDRELTYCLIAPAADRSAKPAAGLYRAVHGAFAFALASLNFAAHVYETQAIPLGTGEAPAQEPFLCFQRRSPGDLLIDAVHGGADKIGGSAQRRRGGAVLQHGSILLQRSTAAPELIGVEDLHPTNLGWREWQDLLGRQLARWLSLEFQIRELSHAERSQAAELEQQKYGNQAWIERR